MNEPMTDREVLEYAEKLNSMVDETGTLTEDGLFFIQENVPSPDDQQRIIQTLKDLVAHEREENNQDSGQEEATTETASEEEAETTS